MMFSLNSHILFTYHSTTHKSKVNPGIQFFYGIFDSRVSLRELRFSGGWVAFVS